MDPELRPPPQRPKRPPPAPPTSKEPLPNPWFSVDSATSPAPMTIPSIISADFFQPLPSPKAFALPQSEETTPDRTSDVVGEDEEEETLSSLRAQQRRKQTPIETEDVLDIDLSPMTSPHVRDLAPSQNSNALSFQDAFAPITGVASEAPQNSTEFVENNDESIMIDQNEQELESNMSPYLANNNNTTEEQLEESNENFEEDGFSANWRESLSTTAYFTPHTPPPHDFEQYNNEEGEDDLIETPLVDHNQSQSQSPRENFENYENGNPEFQEEEAPKRSFDFDQDQEEIFPEMESGENESGEDEQSLDGNATLHFDHHNDLNDQNFSLLESPLRTHQAFLSLTSPESQNNNNNSPLPTSTTKLPYYNIPSPQKKFDSPTLSSFKNISTTPSRELQTSTPPRLIYPKIENENESFGFVGLRTPPPPTVGFVEKPLPLPLTPQSVLPERSLAILGALVAGHRVRRRVRSRHGRSLSRQIVDTQLMIDELPLDAVDDEGFLSQPGLLAQLNTLQSAYIQFLSSHDPLLPPTTSTTSITPPTKQQTTKSGNSSGTKKQPMTRWSSSPSLLLHSSPLPPQNRERVVVTPLKIEKECGKVGILSAEKKDENEALFPSSAAAASDSTQLQIENENENEKNEFGFGRWEEEEEPIEPEGQEGQEREGEKTFTSTSSSSESDSESGIEDNTQRVSLSKLKQQKQQVKKEPPSIEERENEENDSEQNGDSESEGESEGEREEERKTVTTAVATKGVRDSLAVLRAKKAFAFGKQPLEKSPKSESPQNQNSQREEESGESEEESEPEVEIPKKGMSLKTKLRGRGDVEETTTTNKSKSILAKQINRPPPPVGRLTSAASGGGGTSTSSRPSAAVAEGGEREEVVGEDVSGSGSKQFLRKEQKRKKVEPIKLDFSKVRSVVDCRLDPSQIPQKKAKEIPKVKLNFNNVTSRVDTNVKKKGTSDSQQQQEWSTSSSSSSRNPRASGLGNISSTSKKGVGSNPLMANQSVEVVKRAPSNSSSGRNRFGFAPQTKKMVMSTPPPSQDSSPRGSSFTTQQQHSGNPLLSPQQLSHSSNKRGSPDPYVADLIQQSRKKSTPPPPPRGVGLQQDSYYYQPQPKSLMEREGSRSAEWEREQANLDFEFAKFFSKGSLLAEQQQQSSRGMLSPPSSLPYVDQNKWVSIDRLETELYYLCGSLNTATVFRPDRTSVIPQLSPTSNFFSRFQP